MANSITNKKDDVNVNADVNIKEQKKQNEELTEKLTENNELAENRELTESSELNETEFDEELKNHVIIAKADILLKPIDQIVSWLRYSSVWPLTFGLSCCAIEMMAAAGANNDIARFGMEVYRASPRQADLMIVAGTVTHKMAPRVKRLYDQMAEPKYVIAMGACTISGGPYAGSYAVLKGVDKIIPVDVYIPGCPPKPEALLEGIIKLREKIGKERTITRKLFEITKKFKK